VPIGSVTVLDGFWKDRTEAGRRTGIPRLYDLLEEHGVVDNFRRLSTGKKVDRMGPVFTDSDLYKWMEAASLALQSGDDPGLESALDQVVDVVVGAQGDDGYLNTCLVDERRKDRFTNLEGDHELYCAGHLIQAAVAHNRATGKLGLLDSAARFADYLVGVFGPGKRRGFCGHPELEMAMVELYRATGRDEYLEFAGYLLDQVGFSSLQEMEGHAVRAGYACCGGADYYAETGDASTWTALQRLWQDMTQYKVYVTGGVGSRYVHESFGEPYELPNLRAYAETCAAISNAMWAWRMFTITGECGYADMLETVLYNGFLSGVSLAGDEYFYVNPLESSGSPDDMSTSLWERGHVRKEWYSCTCCPTNVQRVMASIPGYVYGAGPAEVWLVLYQSSRLDLELDAGTVVLEQRTRYPWDGEVNIVFESAPGEKISLLPRIPGWSSGCHVSVNGNPVEPVVAGSFLRLERTWSPGDAVRISFEMPVELVRTHPRVREGFGCAAIHRGPVVYCVESIDNPGTRVRDLVLGEEPRFVYEFAPDLLGGVGTISFDAMQGDGAGPLYAPVGTQGTGTTETRAKAIPYYAWANRGKSSMLVWLPRSECIPRD
jgi:DUF1680 family protein